MTESNAFSILTFILSFPSNEIIKPRSGPLFEPDSAIRTGQYKSFPFKPNSLPISSIFFLHSCESLKLKESVDFKI